MLSIKIAIFGIDLKLGIIITYFECLEITQVAISYPIITFTPDDFKRIQAPHADPLVVTLKIANCIVKGILIDGGSSVDILFFEAFEEMGLNASDIEPMLIPLTAFDGKVLIPVGTIKAPVAASNQMVMVEFVVVAAKSTYNAIMGRSWIHKMNGVPSTLHQVMRCIDKDGKVFVIKGD